MSKLRIAGFSLVTLVGLLPVVAAAQAPQQAPLTMKQLKPNVWVGLGGAGGNSTIVVGPNSVVVVDAKQTEAGAKDLLAQIAKITPKKVSTVILTHSDGDHVNGLVAFPAGIKIVADEFNVKEQEKARAAGGRGAPPADRVPNVVVRYYAIGQGAGMEEEKDMDFDGVKTQLYWWGRGHTNGDLIVYFPDEKVVATGDIITTNRADDNPNIHLEKDGSSQGWIWNVKGILGIQNVDVYVPGHGDLITNKADIQKKVDATQAKRDKIVALIQQKKSLAEIKASFGENSPTPATFVDTVYNELTKNGVAVLGQ